MDFQHFDIVLFLAGVVIIPWDKKNTTMPIDNEIFQEHPCMCCNVFHKKTEVGMWMTLYKCKQLTPIPAWAYQKVIFMLGSINKQDTLLFLLSQLKVQFISLSLMTTSQLFWSVQLLHVRTSMQIVLDKPFHDSHRVKPWCKKHTNTTTTNKKL